MTDASAATVNASIATYRYLRLSVVGLALLLGTSVAIEALWGTSSDRGSISAYYYGPVRGVFVGALVAMGLGLIAIKARNARCEDVMLNLAGMLAPVVALVPTPVTGTSDQPCAPEHEGKCVPLAFIPGVENNVRALLVLGVVGLVFAWWMARREALPDPLPRRSVVGLLVGAGVLVAFGVIFFVAQGFFLEYAHYGSAIPMFGLIIAVAAVNVLKTEKGITIMGRELTYRPIYIVIAVAMLVVVLAALVYLILVLTPLLEAWTGWLFLVEALLLALFTTFWAFQTAEFWNEGVPEG